VTAEAFVPLAAAVPPPFFWRRVRYDGSSRTPHLQRQPSRLAKLRVALIREARRMLRPGRLFGSSRLTFGFTTLSRIVSWTWPKIYALRLSLVGGCHPRELLDVQPEKASKVFY
jgi:hypothetical protein